MLPKIGGAINAQLRKRLKENENASLSTCFKETSNALAWPKFVRGAGMRFTRSLRIAIRHGSADPQRSTFN